MVCILKNLMLSSWSCFCGERLLQMKWICFVVIKESCESPDWIGDLYCDDGNNHEACHYDGGDCCHCVPKVGPLPTFQFSSCVKCLCHVTEINVTCIV